MYFVLFGCILFRYNMQAKEDLTVDSAIKAIWKMSYKDISRLYKIVFEESAKDKSSITTKISEVCQSVAQAILGKSQEAQILDILYSESIANEQKERILQAIKESYDEYTGRCSGASIFMTILFPPLGLLSAYGELVEHRQAVEAKRLAL